MRRRTLLRASAAALAAFQRQADLPESGDLDHATSEALLLTAPAFTTDRPIAPTEVKKIPRKPGANRITWGPQLVTFGSESTRHLLPNMPTGSESGHLGPHNKPDTGSESDQNLSKDLTCRERIGLISWAYC